MIRVLVLARTYGRHDPDRVSATDEIHNVGNPSGLAVRNCERVLVHWMHELMQMDLVNGDEIRVPVDRADAVVAHLAPRRVLVWRPSPELNRQPATLKAATTR